MMAGSRGARAPVSALDPAQGSSLNFLIINARNRPGKEVVCMGAQDVILFAERKTQELQKTCGYSEHKTLDPQAETFPDGLAGTTKHEPRAVLQQNN